MVEDFPASFLSPLVLGGVRSGWVILDCQDCSGWRARAPGDSPGITLHEKRNMAKSLLDDLTAAFQ